MTAGVDKELTSPCNTKKTLGFTACFRSLNVCFPVSFSRFSQLWKTTTSTECTRLVPVHQYRYQRHLRVQSRLHLVWANTKNLQGKWEVGRSKTLLLYVLIQILFHNLLLLHIDILECIYFYCFAYCRFVVCNAHLIIFMNTCAI